MAKTTISLKEILFNHIPESVKNEGFSFGDVDEQWIVDAMRDACKQSLIAAGQTIRLKSIEVPYTGVRAGGSRFDKVIDGDSIMDTMKLIEG